MHGWLKVLEGISNCNLASAAFPNTLFRKPLPYYLGNPQFYIPSTGTGYGAEKQAYLKHIIINAFPDITLPFESSKCAHDLKAATKALAVQYLFPVLPLHLRFLVHVLENFRSSTLIFFLQEPFLSVRFVLMRAFPFVRREIFLISCNVVQQYLLCAIYK